MSNKLVKSTKFTNNQVQDYKSNRVEYINGLQRQATESLATCFQKVTELLNDNSYKLKPNELTSLAKILINGLESLSRVESHFEGKSDTGIHQLWNVIVTESEDLLTAKLKASNKLFSVTQSPIDSNVIDIQASDSNDSSAINPFE